MNEITVTADELVVVPHGLDKLWSFTRELRIPLTHVRGATADPGVIDEPRGMRAPGLAMPGKYAGSFHRDGDVTFWNVSDPRDNLVIELQDEKYRRLVLTVTDPAGEERRINAAVQTAG